MPDSAEIRAVLERFGFDVGAAAQPFSGGFSGAEIWRVETAAGPCCLRRWPEEGPPVERIRWMHTILRRAYAAGCMFVPLALRAEATGDTVVLHGGRHWELTNWMSGTPPEGPTLNGARLVAAARGLAMFHGALAEEPWAGAVEEMSPGLAERLARIDDGLASGLRELRSAPVPFEWAALQMQRDDYVALFAPAASIVRPRLVDGLSRRRRLQPCIRDIRREHLLFVGDELTGLVDFGALQMDHPAIDTARLIGECVGGDASSHATALDAYRSAAPCELADAADPTLIDSFDGANLVLSPGNWLRWILIERREFTDRAAVVRRMDELLSRLRRLVHSQ